MQLDTAMASDKRNDRMLKKTSLSFLILAFAGLSIYCQVSLFVSLMSNTQDQWHAGIFSAVLIYSQYMFTAQMAIKWRNKQITLAGIAAVLTVVQIIISTVITAFYFESRYQSANSLATTTSNEHVIVKGLITGKQRTIEQFKSLAAEELEKGNKWIAGQHMQKADRIEQELPALLAQLQSIKVTAKGGAALGSAMGEWRWVAWFTLSVLADLIPATAILLFVFSEKNSRTEAVSVEIEQEELSEEPQPMGATDLQSLIAELGDMPSWREAKAAGLTYLKYKTQREDLQKQGVIKQTGQTFSLA